MRLQKFLAAAGVASRRKSEELIEQGRVTVNGEIVDRQGVVVNEGDRVCVDGKPVRVQTAEVYWMFNKPMGVVTTMADEKGRRCVGDYFAGQSVRVFPVGRLDYDTHGLLLMTNDGEMANRLMHPSYQVGKTYRVAVLGQADEECLRKLRRGVRLEDGMTAPARVESAGTTPRGEMLRVTVHEGRNRQVRRMMEAVGLQVVDLERISLGPLMLGDLPIGQYRPLTSAEVEALRRSLSY